jgi:arginine deiminase
MGTQLRRVDRREALGLLAAGAMAAAWRPAESAAGLLTPSQLFVTSDVARLRRVIMCPPGTGVFTPSSIDDDVMPMADWDDQAVLSEHAALVAAIRSSGAEVLSIPDLLSSAIDAARSRGAWETWLRATHPKLAGDPKSVTAQTLLGRDPATQNRTWPDSTYRHILD